MLCLPFFFYTFAGSAAYRAVRLASLAQPSSVSREAQPRGFEKRSFTVRQALPHGRRQAATVIQSRLERFRVVSWDSVDRALSAALATDPRNGTKHHEGLRRDEVSTARR